MQWRWLLPKNADFAEKIRSAETLPLKYSSGLANSLARCRPNLKYGLFSTVTASNSNRECGTGNVLRVLRQACPRRQSSWTGTLVDGLRHAQRRSAGLLVQGDVLAYPFGKQFDLIGMFDLEHLPRERETLLALREALIPGGKLMLTVPAHQFLWSHFDEAACHCRRYSPASIGKSLVEAGFEVEFLSQFMACIFPMVWVFRKIGGLFQNSSFDGPRKLVAKEFRLVPVVNEVLASLLSLEARWLARGHTMPIGTSLVVVARRAL